MSGRGRGRGRGGGAGQSSNLQHFLNFGAAAAAPGGGGPFYGLGLAGGDNGAPGGGYYGGAGGGGDGYAAAAAPAAAAPAPAAPGSYHALIAATTAEQGLQPPVRPPPGSSKEAMQAYQDAYDEYKFNVQSRDMQLRTEAEDKLHKSNAALRERDMQRRGCIERCGYFPHSYLLRHGPLVALFRWLDAEAAYHETADDRRYYNRGDGKRSGGSGSSSSSATAATDAPAFDDVEYFVAAVRQSPRTGRFNLSLQAVAPTAPFVLISSAGGPPGDALEVMYSDPRVHPLAGHSVYAEALAAQAVQQQKAAAAAAYQQLVGAAGTGGAGAVASRSLPLSPAGSPVLQVGDQVIMINGVSLRQLGISHATVQPPAASAAAAPPAAEQRSLAIDIALSLCSHVSAKRGTLLLLVRRSAEATRIATTTRPAGGAGALNTSARGGIIASPLSSSSSSPSSSSSSSSSAASRPLLRMPYPSRPEWSFAASEPALRAAAVALLTAEKDGLRYFREPGLQWLQKRLLPRLEAALGGMGMAADAKRALRDATLARALALVDTIPPPPPVPGAINGTGGAFIPPPALPALAALETGYCSPLVVPGGVGGVGAPGHASVALLDGEANALKLGLSAIPAPGRGGSIPDIFWECYTPPSNDDDDDGEVVMVVDDNAAAGNSSSTSAAAAPAAAASGGGGGSSSSSAGAAAGQKRPLPKPVVLSVDDDSQDLGGGGGSASKKAKAEDTSIIVLDDSDDE